MFCVFKLANSLPRLSLYAKTPGLRNVSTCVNPLCFRATNVLLGEPLKKKKKVDPAILRQRDERRKKKLEKQIRRLEKVGKQLKPIFENEVPLKLIDSKEERTRRLSPIPENQIERRELMEKEWTKYKARQWMANVQTIDAILFSQQRALNELKAESEELYNQAIQIDSSLLPYKTIGPVDTPPIHKYDSLDGEYVDVSQKYEGET